MSVLADMDLDSLWVAEVGTEPPEFGVDSPWDYSAELAALPWADSVVWAERILGRGLLPGQTAKLKKLHGYDGFRCAKKKREAVARRAGNGLERAVAKAGRWHSREDDAALRDIGTDGRHLVGNWGRVNGHRGINSHNLRVAGRARSLRIRVLKYCLASARAALASGGDFDLKRVFKAACARIFGCAQPYANRSRVRVFREWVERELALENVTHPPEAALIVARGAMRYASSEATGDSQNITHLPGTAGAPTADEARQGGQNAPGAAFEGEAGPAMARNWAGGCAPLNPEGRCPSRDAGPSPCSAKARAARQRLVGIARSALPTLREAHETHARIPWKNAQQSRWAFGWMTAHLRRGCDAKDLVRIYLELLARHDDKAKASGFGVGQMMPWGLRKRLQIRAEGLPVYPEGHFTGNSTAFQPTAQQLRERREKKAAREFLAATKSAKRVRRRSAGEIERMLAETLGPIVADETPAAPEVPEWIQAIEDDLADMNAESAARDMDRANNADALRRQYIAGYNDAAAAGDFEKCRRLMASAEANGITL